MAEKKDKITEILAPCGNRDAFRAAVNAGCDACYLAGKSFGARAYADNFDENELIDIIHEAHLKNVRVYLALNTLLKNSEIKELYDYVLPYYENGLDAVIVQDMGVLKFIRKEFPDMAIHCSTQMNICSHEGAIYAKKLGASRIVSARELSLKEIQSIREHTDIEIETFVHGAMCFSFSGRCLMSSLAGGRSGNRGRCAQPCRKCYNGSYKLSMKDMCTLKHVPKFIEAGIDSLKIEGRMKNEYYTASAVDAYRCMRDDYLNGCFSEEKAEKYAYRLANIYNRGGFSDGYFFMQNGKSMIDTERPNNKGVKVGVVKSTEGGAVIINTSQNIFRMDVLEIKLSDTDAVELTSNINASAGSKIKLNSPKIRQIKPGADVYRTRCNKLLGDIRDEIINNDKKVKIDCKFTANPDEEINLKLGFNTLGRYISVSVYGDKSLDALQRPTDEASVYEKLSKLGDTCFELEEANINLSENTFIPMSSINNLKRKAVKMLIEECNNTFNRKKERPEEKSDVSISMYSYDSEINGNQNIILTASVQNITQLEALISSDSIREVYIDTACFDLDLYKKAAELVRKSGRKVIASSPQIVSERNIRFYNDFERMLEVSDGVNIKSIDTYAYLINKSIVKNNIIKDDFTVILASSLYCMNNEAAGHFYSELLNKNARVIFDISKELNRREIQDMSYPGNSEAELGIYGYEALMVTAQCINKNEAGCGLYENRSVYLTDDMNNKFICSSYCRLCYNVIYNGLPLNIRNKEDNIKRYRLDFTTEDKSTVLRLIKEFRQALFNDVKLTPSCKYTTGHFNRGIE